LTGTGDGKLGSVFGECTNFIKPYC
jgi:hypothetical protein